MKKLINEPGAAVNEVLDEMVMAHPGLRRLDGTNVLVRDDTPVERRAVTVPGGGSDHEPAHVGYLGEGMFDGAAADEVFTSSTADQLDGVIQATDAGRSALCVVKNYESDMMNFDIVAEMTGMEGVDVKQVVVNDGMVVEDLLYTSGRRGVAGTIFIHKCTGAKAAAGGDFDGVMAIAERVVDNVRMMGMALISCVTPRKGEPVFGPGEDEIELGIDIHGEPGTERTDVMNIDEITERLTENALDDFDLGEGEEVVMMVNGMGGTPLSELHTINRKPQSTLDDRSIETWDAWVGDYMASLDMTGCSVSVLRVDDESKELFGAPAETSDLTVIE